MDGDSGHSIVPERKDELVTQTLLCAAEERREKRKMICVGMLAP